MFVIVTNSMRVPTVGMPVTMMLGSLPMPMRVATGMVVMPQPRNRMQHMSPA